MLCGMECPGLPADEANQCFVLPDSLLVSSSLHRVESHRANWLDKRRSESLFLLLDGACKLTLQAAMTCVQQLWTRRLCLPQLQFQ